VSVLFLRKMNMLNSLIVMKLLLNGLKTCIVKKNLLML
jgi:hypothetical protein